MNGAVSTVESARVCTWSRPPHSGPMTHLHATLTLDDGGDFVAAVPTLLGFHPADSLVVLTVADDGGPTCRIGQLLRTDLPDSREARSLARYLSQVCAQNDARRVLILIIEGTADPLPRRPLVDMMRAEFDKEGMSVERAFWAASAWAGEKWWCYDDPECTGDIPDPDTVPLAAALTVAGLVKYPTRAALAATLAPDPPDAMDRRTALLDARLGAEFSAAESGTCESAAFTRDWGIVDAALDDFAPSTVDSDGPDGRREPPWNDERIVALTAALCHSDIRSECLKIALTPRAPAAVRLWTRLTRSAPAPERAEPAVLLAIGAYLGGDGPLAQIALDVALEAHPTHPLATLLRAAIGHAIAPTELREIITRASQRSTRAAAAP